jgi:DNA-directed RNA polymerase specialized sigma24 family protein
MIEAELKNVLKIEDPVERAKQLHTEMLYKVSEIRRQIIEARALAIKESCEFGGVDADGLSYSEIAQELGVSKPLIQQMVALARKIIAGGRAPLE